MSEPLVNRQYLALLLGIDGDGSMCSPEMLSKAVAELQLAVDLVRTQEITVRIAALDKMDALTEEDNNE